MSNPNSKLGIYNDLIIAEALLGDSRLLKNAQAQGLMSSIIEKVKNYFGSKVDPNDRAGSVLNMLAPGMIAVTFGALGMPWFGRLLGLAASFFHFDVASILETIWNKLKEELGDNKKITSEQIHQITQSAVQQHTSPATEEEADTAAQQAEQAEQNKSDDGFSLSSQLRTAKLLRLAMEEEFINKNAASKNWFSLFSSRKAATGNLLSNLLSLLFRVAFASAGLLVAGDVMNKFLGRSNSFDGTIQNGKSTDQVETTTSQVAGPNDTIKNSPTVNWIESVPNNQNSIEQMLLNFAKEVYPNLAGQESLIQNDPKFQYLVETVTWYNHESPGGPIVFIPRMFTTKKQLVDTFAPEVLEKAKQMGDMKAYKI